MTISINTVLDFDVLPIEMASRILYDHLVPTCEKQGVKLSFDGNYAAPERKHLLEVYEKNKKKEKLFDIERIQRAYSCLGDISTRTYEAVESCVLKRIIETYQGEYISNGDCIAAMLLKGYIAHFETESPQLSCRFSTSLNK